MKLFFIYTLFMVGFWCSAQNTLTFTYDVAGNQTGRELICVSCYNPTASRPASTPEQPEEEDMVQSMDYDQISYYPNPVQEKLYIKWYSDENMYVINLEVYSMVGQLVALQSNLEKKNNTSVEFQNVTEGIYNVILVYNNGERKILKVIKK